MLSADTSHKASANKCYLDDVVKCEGTGMNIQMKLVTIIMTLCAGHSGDSAISGICIKESNSLAARKHQA
jgi:hypothetical protein